MADNLDILLNTKLGTASTVPVEDRSAPSDTEPKLAPEENMPCGHKMNGRNLIVCIDGTSNQFGEKNTNVIEMYNLILKKVHHNQRSWYNSGIGTYARPSWKSLSFYKKVLYHKIDLAIAWDFERTVLGAYRWLSDNYEEGDCIFLFGFSRGAYQVRVLSAMIDKVGLIYKGNEMQIPFAYELYADPKSDKRVATQVGSEQNTGKVSFAKRFKSLFSHENPEQKTGADENISMAERFKSAFSHEDVKVHFIGAWDTVSSIGIARGQHMLPRTIDGMTHVCYFRHALALDERRVKFLPEYAYGGAFNPPARPEANYETPDMYDTSAIVIEDAPIVNSGSLGNLPSAKKEDMATHTEQSIGKRPHTMEVWFAGTHSDIGGGNVKNAGMDRSRPPLRWMVFEAGKVGLRTARFKRDLSSNEQIEIKESLTWLWWPLEVLLLKRLTFTRREDGKQTTHWFHLGSRRKIHLGQKIHSSLLLADKTRPDLVSRSLTVKCRVMFHRMMGQDYKYDAKYIPKARPLNDDKLFWENLSRDRGTQWLEVDLYEYTESIVESFIAELHDTALQTLRQIATSGDGRQAVYEKVIEALKRNRDTYLLIDVKHRLLASALDILGKSAREDPLFKLSPSINIRPLVSDLWKSGNKSYQKTMQEFVIWLTDPCLLVLQGHTDQIMSVAFSPNSSHIVSGSYDKTVRIWDAETGILVEEPFRGHTDPLMSVAFSDDGKRIVSGSVNKVVQIWDAQTGKPVGEPFRGHTDSVGSVAFSPDDKHIVSGSWDNTVRIWDVKTGKLRGEPFRGHTDRVMSVAFSPDGTRVVSGSGDKTVRIWEAETGKLVATPFQGHTSSVVSVAFLPDGNRVVSGSGDKTIRIWEADTGKLAGNPFQGHTLPVMSVAILSDGKHIVSGSSDKTVRIWNAETGEPVGKPFRGHTDQVVSVASSSDGKHIISGSLDKTVRVWDVETGKLVGEPFRRHIEEVNSVSFSLDGTRVVSGSHANTVQIWDAETGTLAGDVLQGHTDRVGSVAFSPDGNLVVSGSWDQTVRIWDSEMWKLIGEPIQEHTESPALLSKAISGFLDKDHLDEVNAVGFSPDCTRVVSRTHDKVLQIWDAESGAQVGDALRGHTDWVGSVAFSPDGKLVVSGSRDQTIRIWDAEMYSPI